MKPTAATMVMVAPMLMASLSARPAAADTRCKVEITGDKTLTVTAPAADATAAERLMAASDQWSSEKALRESVSLLVPPGTADKDKEKWIERQMKKDPRGTALTLLCRTKDFNLSFQPVEGTTYAQVPMKPKKYTLASDNAVPGQFVAGVFIGPAPKPERYRISEPGTIEITEFTGKHVTAKFSFKAALGAKKIAVAGTISADCTGDKCGK